MTFKVAILGRPNVGKSTLFNRLVGKRLALVDETPGVTRDRREGEAAIADLAFTAIDTAGLEDAPEGTLEAAMRRQTEAALAEADVILLLIDARAGVTPMDSHFANWLRKSSRPVILLANKCEGGKADAGLLEAFQLGLGEPLAVSAAHGRGLDALYDALRGAVPAREVSQAETTDAEAPIRLAIVGRPNVGKSTLINKLLGRERLLTGPEPGVTRDAITVEWRHDGRPVQLVDTAGMRRRARVAERLEKLAVADARRAVDMAEIALLVLDGQAGLERQDLAIAAYALDEGRGLIIVVNKWDVVADRAAMLRAVRERLETSLAQARGVPVVTLSALTGQGLKRLMPTVLAVHRRWNKRIATAVLNRWLAEMIERHPPPLARGRRIRIRYMTQVKSRPPTFAIFASQPRALPTAYLRYMENGLRDAFDLPGVPIRLMLRKGDNPYA